MKTGPWITVTVAKDGTTSSETDLSPDSKLEFEDVQVYNPALDSATITVQVCRKTGDTAVATYQFNHAATGDFANATTARTGAGMNVFKDICARFIKIVLGAGQTTAARTFYVRGISR